MKAVSLRKAIRRRFRILEASRGRGTRVRVETRSGVVRSEVLPPTDDREMKAARSITVDEYKSDSSRYHALAGGKGTRGKTPGKEEDRQMSCNYGALLKSNFVFCKIYLMEQITSVLHYSPIQNCCQR